MITLDPFAADALPGWFALAAAIVFIAVGKWRDWFGSKRVAPAAVRKSGEDGLHVGANFSGPVIVGLGRESLPWHGVVDPATVVIAGAKSRKRRRKYELGNPETGTDITRQAAPRKTG